MQDLKEEQGIDYIQAAFGHKTPALAYEYVSGRTQPITKTLIKLSKHLHKSHGFYLVVGNPDAERYFEASGQGIKSFRESRALSQRWLALLSKHSAQTIKKLEGSATRLPSLNLMEAICLQYKEIAFILK